jgi:hypothetical protein
LAGNSASLTVPNINVDATAPVVTPPPNQVLQQTIEGGSVVNYPTPGISETGSGIASSSCLPASGSVFPVGLTTVACTAMDLAGNAGSTTFAVTVNPAPAGRMFGVGFVNQGRLHRHFVFRVARNHDHDDGRFEFWGNDPHRCRREDDDDQRTDFDGNDDDDYGRDHHNPPNHFEATAITSVIFSDDSGFQPARDPKTTIDMVRFNGTGVWNGRPGYTFEVLATDQGEPGRYRDTFSLVVRGSQGGVVASVSGSLESGNIQSTRLSR